MSHQNIHQVITGALNSGENSFSIGCVDGVSFIACAVGADVAILAPNFDRVQIIPGNELDHGEIVSAVTCCGDSGKIAAVYGLQIRIFEPSQGTSTSKIVPYQWHEVHRMNVKKRVSTVQWVLEGLRLLVMCSSELILYQHQLLSTAVKDNHSTVTFSINDEKADSGWDILWKTDLAFEVKVVKFSSDGTLFATCGENDNLVKIWYQQDEPFVGNKAHFTYTYLQHPATVTGFEWRRTSRYMPRKCVQNAIITWCEDNTSRIWKQIPKSDSQLEALIEAVDVVSRTNERTLKKNKSFRIKKARRKLVTKISQLVQKDVSRVRSESSSQSSNLTRSATFADFNVPASTVASLHFCLVATIDADNDCFLVPSLDSGTPASRQPFVIHWLNNKELIFAMGAEKILTDTVLNEQFEIATRASSKAKNSPDSPHDEDIPEPSEERSSSVPGTPLPEKTPSLPMSRSSTVQDLVVMKDMLDTKLEGLLREWNKCVDVVFSVYPVDGSLLTWTIEWLDDTWKQPTINFASRFPNAFPLTDAASLNLSLYTFNPYNPVYAEVAQRQSPEPNEHERADRIITRRQIDVPKNTVHLLTSHVNGSLNLWDLTTEENCAFTHILNIVHKSRMCGHRFHISKVIAHPVLPLLLTASQSTTEPEKDNESELILWKVSPVSPLCKSGGVRELSRLTSISPSAFDCLSWVPAILPSSTLGTICNSPSSCFIASNNGRLCIYQAVVDARGLLAELYSSKTIRKSMSSSDDFSEITENENIEPKHDLTETFNVVSTQSTAKPGCILFLEDVDSSEHISNDMLMLHVFNEELTLKHSQSPDDHPEFQNSSVIDRSQSSTFVDNYFIVMVVKTETEDRLKMWSLTVSSQIPQPIKNYVDDEDVKNENSENEKFYPTATPNPPSAAKLEIKTKMVYNEKIVLPDYVRVTSCVVAAGHLPSASLYPACRAPYLLVISCTDDHVRFLRCCTKENEEKINYEWSYWKMISNDINSDLEMDGEVYTVSCAHSGRFAAAYHSGAATLGHKVGSSLTQNIEVAVFECESSGGVEWLQEDSFNLDKYVIETAGGKSLSNTAYEYHGEDEEALTERIRGLVRLDWVSAEDGSHILTVGIGHTIYLFSQVSRDVAQQNIVMMKETDTKSRGHLRKASSLVGSIHMSNKFVRWMCVRTLELQSADGFPPLPTAMSWVRDGMLIVGLHSEMRIYNQWNLTTCDAKPSRIEKAESKPPQPTQIAITDVDEGRIGSPLAPKAMINISRSHSVLEQLSKRSKHDTSSNNKMMKEIMNKVFSSINLNELNSKDDTMLRALSEEGLFEASRLANPMLPQYHPKQLIEMLNSGKTKRVKAILLHIIRTLKQRSVAGVNALQRAASVRRLGSMDATSMDINDIQLQNQRSIQVIDDDNADYEEIGNIPPLPLFALLEADETVTGDEKAANINQNEEAYDTLFVAENNEEDLDDLLTDGYDAMSRRSRSRQSSGSFDQAAPPTKVDVSFTARHCRILTELLTHMQLPGLSSVDQMHLLSIADTLSHFSSSTIDRLIQANAAFNTSNHATSSEAGTSKGVESVDECGLRFLMAMKQHEYLLRCLPLKQRQQLRTKGLSTAHIIWALHSDSEMELYNAIPCVQRNQESWEELRSYGLAWWLKDATALRNCVERMAKTAFQQNQDPMDAALYYLSLKKKNVLTHLFKTIQDQAKADFFRNDFTEVKWKKAAEKNAFVLMGKQKFRQAAALFLLAGSLTDAIKQLLKLRDIQLAMVVIRLFESDPERQSSIINEILCNEVLGIHIDHVKRTSVNSPTEASFMSPTNNTHSNDAFERSMAYWLVKNYAKSASTLLEEANKTSFSVNGGFTGCSLSDIFNLYSYLRRHPLVTRQRLTDAGIQTGSTEKVFQLARELESRVTPSERRLFFRTASVHMASGCPLLALDVLLRLPKQLGDFLPDDGNIADALNEGKKSTNATKAFEEPQTVNSVDWSAPTNVVKDDELKLDWSDEEAEDEENEKEKGEEEKVNHVEPEINGEIHATAEGKVARSIDFIAQHLKFVAALRVFMEELATLASGFEVDGGQLRCELFRWLEKECIVLRDICDYQMDLVINVPDFHDDIVSDLNDLRNITLNDLRLDQQGSYCRSPARRRLWLSAHQKLIRTFTSYCALHGAQNYRLTSVLMELLLLLLELQQDKTIWSQRDDSSPKVRPFPLLVGSLWNCRMFLSSPLHFIETQSTDLLLTIIEFSQPLGFDLSLPKVYELYNLCQGLSSCLYQSLTDIDNSWTSGNPEGSVSNIRRYNSFSAASEDMPVVSQPCRWPGVQSFIALLECEKDEDCPNLQQLIAECFVAISMSLFCYSFSLYDSRWLFRLMAHEINAKAFGTIFGGAGEQKLRPIPSRPPPPRPDQNSSSQGDSIRAKLHAKVFGVSPQSDNRRREDSQSEQVISCWLPPKKHVVQFFAEKVELYGDEAEYDYESDDAQSVESMDGGEEEGHDKEPRPHDSPNSYAWHLMRLALALQQMHRMKQFLALIGFDLNDLPSTSPRMSKILKVLESWIEQLNETLERYPGGCPANFLPNPYVDVDVSTHNVPLLRKYRLLIEAGNTPFEYDSKGVKAVKRLWSYLVRQENLSGHFIKFIFEKNGAKDVGKESSLASGANSNTSKDSHTVVKIMHREQEPILAFATSNVKQSWIAVSNGREIQEISMDTLFEEQQNLADNRTSYLNNRVALDIALEKNSKDTLRDNDDYQVLLDGKIKTNTSFITPFILDRSRVSLKKLRKRQVNGVRRLEAHPTLPYYVSGASDGSILLWEWGLEQPLFTARSAGQYAKVTKLAFSLNGNKFAAVDGDGLLCMWQAAQSVAVRKPYFNQKCHTKAAADVKFLGQTSSLLVTVGHSSGDANVTLWDTLMPSSKATVHSFIGHQDGAMCVAYLANSQTIVSGGRHGEVCLWDIRQRQLRTTIRAFDSASVVKALCIDPNGDYIIVGSSDGDIKMYNTDSTPSLLYNFTGEHAARGGFSLRQVGIQGIQQLSIDSSLRLFSCGADCSLKFRPLLSVVQNFS